MSGDRDPTPYPGCPAHPFLWNQQKDLIESVKQDNRDSQERYARIDRKIDNLGDKIVEQHEATTGELKGMAVSIAKLVAKKEGRDEMAAEHTGRVELEHKRKIAWAGVAVKTIVALAGAGAALGIRLAFWG
jgi:ribulose 1,5-bisphosphate carboxylase large subunit-like protein